MGRSASGTDAHVGGEADEQPEHDVAVSDFHLDTYEVTVGRFRAFVEQYDGTAPPAGAGAHPMIWGSGWQAGWAGKLPGTRDALTSDLYCFSQKTWTDTAGANETYPINCVSWYASFAFCVWDGGRLPTEAEWEYASAGGADNRLYPWGQQAPSKTTANYEGSDYSPRIQVGSHPEGAGRWGHQDLAGSMNEWVFDGYAPGWYSGGGSQCSDCANLSGEQRVYHGGGWAYSFPAASVRLRVADRYSFGPSERLDSIGFRCAR